MKKIPLLLILFLCLGFISSAYAKPKNSYIYENNWYCYSGYHKSGNSCIKTINNPKAISSAYPKPKNSYKYENNWYCYSGYHKSGNSCIKTINIPNATRIPNSNDWYCKSGYEREGSSCIEIMKIPANAYRYGGRWICKNGYEKLGFSCIKISNIANSYESNGKWYCDIGYERLEGSCIKERSKKTSSKKTSSDDLFKNIVTLLSILGEAASSATENLSSPSYNPVTPSFNSNSNSSSGYKSSFGNTYQYDLSNPVDRVKYNSDPLAKLRDRVGGNKYQRELESNLGQSGGGIFNNNNSPTWDWVD